MIMTRAHLRQCLRRPCPPLLRSRAATCRLNQEQEPVELTLELRGRSSHHLFRRTRNETCYVRHVLKSTSLTEKGIHAVAVLEQAFLQVDQFAQLPHQIHGRGEKTTSTRGVTMLNWRSHSSLSPPAIRSRCAMFTDAPYMRL